MLMKRIFILSMLLVISLWGGVAYADNSNSVIYQMAEIMNRLKHYPSPAGKDILRNIIKRKNTKENERVIAAGILGLEHHVMMADKPKLKKVIETSESMSERDLASIVLNLDHRPTSADKIKLSAMLK
jgi:hypothetical protein